MIIDSEALTQASLRLRNGEVVAIPTETVYGLAASIASHSGLQKIFALKQRPFFDPLIVHVASFKEAASCVKEWPPLADFLARTFWPGPLTIVLEKADHIDPLITSGLQTVAVRFPAHPLAQDLIKLTGSPLAAPSANRFGRTSPSTAEHVKNEFPNTGLLVIDGGPCEVGLESTVISFSENFDEVRVLRPGGISIPDIENALTKWSNPVRVVRAESSESPGHTKHHYMPPAPVAILDGNASRNDFARISKDLKRDDFKSPKELELGDDPVIAARLLYSELRRLSESGADLIYVLKSPQKTGGLWDAIWDRLTRASSWEPESGSRL